jgi:hypothetical protein
MAGNDDPIPVTPCDTRLDNATVRKALTVGQAITLQGRDLATLLNGRSRGCIGWIRGYPTTATTSEDQVFATEVDVIAGRLYEVSLMNITPDISNTKQTEFRIRYVTGTASWPNSSSRLLAISLRLSQFELGFVRALYLASATQRVRFRASIASLDGNTVRSWCPGDGGVLAVMDLGIAQPQNGSASNVPPGKTLREYYITADDVQIYYENRSGYTGNLTKYVEHGYFEDGRGHRRTWQAFSSAGYAQLADMVGVPYSDILVAELFLEADNWHNGNGYAIIGYHNKTTLAVPEQNGGVPNKQHYYYPGTGAQWLDLKANGSASGSIVESMQSGYFKGFLFGAASGNDLQFQMVATGTRDLDGETSNPPVLHLKFYK